MKLWNGTTSLLVASLVATSATAFVQSAGRSAAVVALSSSTVREDCGCNGDTTFSGEPSDRVRKDINLRQAIRSSSLFRVSGDEVTMDELIGEPNAMKKPAIVVFLRSLG